MQMRIAMGGVEVRVRGWNGLVTLGVVAAVGASIVEELRKPAEARTWHGRVAGIIPYDYRAPTWERLRKAMWDPADPRVLKDKAFGLGWDVNLAALFHDATAPNWSNETSIRLPRAS